MPGTRMKTLAITALAVTSSAHMVLRQPVPFTNSIGGFGLHNPDNSPLADSGSNYPCHMSGDYSTDSWTQMPQGSSQTLKFLGSAVHGGGSCQISVTYDLAPSKSSVFKVIHSIEGGCPARGVDGNFAANSFLFEAPDQYDFTVPDDLPTGKAVLAWTWFNRVGNREMYMNCAPIEITGSGGKTSAFNSLPDIMVANIGEKQCKVGETVPVAFPNPGSSVERNPRGNFQDVSKQPACSYNWMAGDGQGSIDGGDGGDGGNDGGNDAPSGGDNPSADPTVNIPGGVFITTSPGSPATPTVDPTTTMITTTSGGTTEPTPTSPVVTPPDSGSGGGPGDSDGSDGSDGSDSPGGPGSCTDGMFNCMGSTFSKCDHGKWTIALPLAAGTTCTPGIGTNLNIMATNKKRKRNHARAFLV